MIPHRPAALAFRLPLAALAAAALGGAPQNSTQSGVQTSTKTATQLSPSQRAGIDEDNSLSHTSGEITENARGEHPPLGTYFHTSERCVACHNGMQSASGEDFSIGLDWSASIMANSSRDPYWQASIRRETLDHPESSQHVQDD